MTQHVLITGGCGFIGSNLVRFVLEHRPQWRVTNVDLLTYSGNRANLADLEGHPRYRFVHADIRDRERMSALVREADAVIHLAAESHVDRSIQDTRPFVSTNVLGTQTLLDAAVDAARAGTFRRFVHVSTDEVYGSLPLERPQDRFTEDSPLRPSSPYAASKAASDLLALASHHTFGLDVVVTRCSNNFGAYQYPEKVIPLFVTNLIDGRKVPLYGDGLNVRDWIHVEDHAEAILAALERGRAGRVYNIGADNEHANIELTRRLIALCGRDDSFIQPVADRLGHDRRYAIDSTRAAQELGWKASRSSWPQALEATVRWYRDNERWWRPLKH